MNFYESGERQTDRQTETLRKGTDKSLTFELGDK